jgi:hypothetical protein
MLWNQRKAHWAICSRDGITPGVPQASTLASPRHRHPRLLLARSAGEEEARKQASQQAALRYLTS